MLRGSSFPYVSWDRPQTMGIINSDHVCLLRPVRKQWITTQYPFAVVVAVKIVTLLEFTNQRLFIDKRL